jgi:hypothetical protein
MPKTVKPRSLARYTKHVLVKYLAYQYKYSFQRPALAALNPQAMGAAEAMFRNESYGEKLTAECAEPELLADYVQGKTNRDFAIENWRLDGVFERKHWVEESGRDLGCLVMPEEIATQSLHHEADIRSIMDDKFNEELFQHFKLAAKAAEKEARA